MTFDAEDTDYSMWWLWKCGRIFRERTSSYTIHRLCKEKELIVLKGIKIQFWFPVLTEMKQVVIYFLIWVAGSTLLQSCCSTLPTWRGYYLFRCFFMHFMCLSFIFALPFSFFAFHLFYLGYPIARSVGIVRSRTQTMEFSFSFFFILLSFLSPYPSNTCRTYLIVTGINYCLYIDTYRRIVTERV
jgi:hypothetical protein